MLAAAKVRDCMTASLVTFTPEMGVMEAIRVLLEKRISGAPVVDSHGHLAGMLSEKDCLRVALEVGYHRGWGGRVHALPFRFPRSTSDVIARIRGGGGR